MVNDLMLEIGPFIRSPFVRHKRRAWSDILGCKRVENFPRPIFYHFRPDLTTTLYHADHNRLSHGSYSYTAKSRSLRLFGLVHILDLAADESFVHFNRAREFRGVFVFEHEANPMV